MKEKRDWKTSIYIRFGGVVYEETDSERAIVGVLVEAGLVEVNSGPWSGRTIYCPSRLGAGRIDIRRPNMPKELKIGVIIVIFLIAMLPIIIAQANETLDVCNIVEV